MVPINLAGLDVQFKRITLSDIKGAWRRRAMDNELKGKFAFFVFAMGLFAVAYFVCASSWEDHKKKQYTQCVEFWKGTLIEKDAIEDCK